MNDPFDKKRLQPFEVKKNLDSMAQRVLEIYNELCELSSYFELPCDIEEVNRLYTELFWTVENLSVLGLHQVGLALDDNQF